jgi:uncharacterized protein
VKIKMVDARFKAGADAGLADGEFEAIVSVFGNRDSYGDIMVPGAFNATLASWKDRGDPIPVIWSHDWMNPESHVGVVLDAAEVPAAKFGEDSPAGLWIKGLLDPASVNERAGHVRRLLAGRRVTQSSFAFDETDSGPGTYNGQDGWLIRGVDLFEVGPTLLGANQSTELLGAKSRDGGLAAAHRAIIDLARAKSGSRHSAADAERLNAIHAALVELGVSCGEKSAPTTPPAPPAGQDVTSHESKTDDRQGSAADDVDRETGDVDDSAILLAVIDADAALSTLID